MPDEFGEHLTRDQRSFLHAESLQILQIPRSALEFTGSGTVMPEASFCAA